jgi:hypothetical protein
LLEKYSLLPAATGKEFDLQHPFNKVYCSNQYHPDIYQDGMRKISKNPTWIIIASAEI